MHHLAQFNNGSSIETSLSNIPSYYEEQQVLEVHFDGSSVGCAAGNSNSLVLFTRSKNFKCGFELF